MIAFLIFFQGSLMILAFRLIMRCFSYVLFMMKFEVRIIVQPVMFTILFNNIFDGNTTFMLSAIHMSTMPTVASKDICVFFSVTALIQVETTTALNESHTVKKRFD